jgi:hypothetical protein
MNDRRSPPAATPATIAGLDYEARRARVVALVSELFDLLFLRPPVTAQTSPRHATAKHNPLGSERGFKAAARAGGFLTFKLGRQVAARWEDVEAYAESRPCPVRAPSAPVEVDPDRASLAAMGVRLRPAPARVRSGRRTR